MKNILYQCIEGQTHFGMPRAAKTRLAIQYFKCQMCISCGLAFLCVHFGTWVFKCYSSQHEAGIYADIFVPNVRDL